MLRSEADNMPLFPIHPVRLPVQTAPGCPSGHCRILSRAIKRYTHPKILRSQSGYNTLGFFHIPDNFPYFPIWLLLRGSKYYEFSYIFSKRDEYLHSILYFAFFQPENRIILDFAWYALWYQPSRGSFPHVWHKQMLIMHHSPSLTSLLSFYHYLFI